jgi:Uncharacterized protein conserved in bacteria
MAKKDTIIDAAKQILQQNPGGVRYSDLRRLIQEKHPDQNENTIQGNIWKLDQDFPSEIAKPEKGLFKWIDDDISVSDQKDIESQQIREDKFYQPFADYLTKDLGECTEAEPIGGCMFGKKWGTPDVMGIEKSGALDILKFTQIVSAEIKTNTSNDNLIIAFGQACAYKLFSHKTYLVIPKGSNADDLARMDSLCFLHGIGLIHFNSGNPDSPDFEIRHRAAQHEPDLFYTNNYVRVLAKNGKLFT